MHKNANITNFFVYRKTDKRTCDIVDIEALNRL